LISSGGSIQQPGDFAWDDSAPAAGQRLHLLADGSPLVTFTVPVKPSPPLAPGIHT
jgi:hypothetical protein